MPASDPCAERAQEETTAIERVLAGETAAYEVLVRRYSGTLFRYLLRLVGRPDEAEDLAQEAFLRVYLSLASYDPTYRFSTWLFRIATNLALNRLRAERRWVSLESLAEVPDEPPRQLPDERDDLWPERQAERSDLSRRIQECLEELPPAYRIVVVLRHIADLSYEEIANSTGLPLNTVRSRLHRGRERLGGCLEQRLPKEDLP